MRNLPATGLLLITLLMFAPGASAGAADACFAAGLNNFCVAVFNDLAEVCDTADVNVNVCIGEPCDLVLQPTGCSNIRSTVYDACRTGDLVGHTPCNVIAAAAS